MKRDRDKEVGFKTIIRKRRKTETPEVRRIQSSQKSIPF